MTVLDLTIDQFQRLYAIESNGILSPQDKRIAACAIVLGVTLDEVSAMPLKTIADCYKAIQHDMAKMPELRIKQTCKAGSKKYRLTLRTDKLKTGQFIDMTFFNFQDENLVVQNLHKVMATLSRELTWYGKQKPYDAESHAARSEEFRLNARMSDVWGAASFFLLNSEALLAISQSYLARLTKTQTMDKA